MKFRDTPIRRKLISIILLISSAILLVTGITFFTFEFIAFKHTAIRQLTTIGKIIADNSTAALAFDNHQDAYEILAAVRAENHIVAACLYDSKGNIFSYYPASDSPDKFPKVPSWRGYKINNGYLNGFQPVIQGNQQLGTLYLMSDLGIIYNQLRLFVLIGIIVVFIAFGMAYFMSDTMQKRISTPILSLARTAEFISQKKDYSVRADKHGNDEIGSLTDAFNQMLSQIEIQNRTLGEFNQTLEEKIKERTNELEQVNKELESFSYSVSHDLRSPLRAINGYIRIFHEDHSNKFDEEGRRLMKIIIDNAKRMGILIDDLLEFSRLGRKELNKSDLNMKDMVSQIWEELLKNEVGRNIEFNLKDLPVIFVDGTSIRQVWTNLISNAIKYTRKIENTVIEIGTESKNGDDIFYIKDNGAGFDMKYYNKLFGVFQRLHSDHDFEGTGVGLAIVERIITKHGGKIWAEAKPNEGATFYFTLGNDSKS